MWTLVGICITLWVLIQDSLSRSLKCFNLCWLIILKGLIHNDFLTSFQACLGINLMFWCLVVDRYLNLSKSLSFQRFKFRFELILKIRIILSSRFQIITGDILMESLDIDKGEQAQFLHFTQLKVGVVGEKDLKDQALTYSQKLIFQKHPLCMDHNHSAKVKHTFLTFQQDLKLAK